MIVVEILSDYLWKHATLRIYVLRWTIIPFEYMHDVSNVALVGMCEHWWLPSMDWSPLYILDPRCIGSMHNLVGWWCGF